MMKKLLFLLLSVFTITISSAQITAPVVEQKPETDAKYLAGAVPEVNGKVVFNREATLPEGMTTADAMDKIDQWLERCTKDERIRYTQRLPENPIIGNEIQQNLTMELTFSKSFISHDFADIIFILSVRVEDGKAMMEMSHIVYRYNEGGKVNRYNAEDMIIDKYALNKRKDKLVIGFKKFRIKTIDLFDELQVSLQTELKK